MKRLQRLYQSAARQAGNSTPPPPPILDASLNVALTMVRTDSDTSSIRASVIVPLYNSATQSADHLIITISGVEQAILTPVALGNYASGRPRCLYTEVVVSGATGTVNLVAHFDQGTRTVSALGSRSYASWENATTHLLPTGMMSNMRTLGHAPAFCLPTSATYLCACGAFGPELPVASEGTLGLDASQLTAYNADFDTYLRDYWWDGAANAGNFILANITNHNYLGTTTWNGDHDLSNSSDGYLGWTFTGGETPPGYRAWREAVGVVGYSGGHNYYGADRIFFRRYIRTGNAEYFIRACAYAEGCRHYCRWTIAGSASPSYVQGLGPDKGAWQMEGFGLAYLLTGNPDMLDQLRRMTDNMQSIQAAPPNDDQTVGTYTSDWGEPRPMTRIIDGFNWRLVCEDAANSATWATNLEARLTQVFAGTAVTHWNNATTWPLEYQMYAAKNGGSPSFYNPTGFYNETVYGVDYSDGDHPGVNEFMVALTNTAGRMAYTLCGDYLSSSIKTTILNVVLNAAVRLYEYHFEGQPEQYAAFPDVHNPVQITQPSFYNGFSGSNTFPDLYSLTPDLNLLYPDTLAWLATVLNRSDLTTLAKRIFAFGVPGANLATGNSYAALQKQSREIYCASQDFLYWVSQAPAAGAVASDVVTQVTLEETVSHITGVTAFTIVSGDTSTSLLARARNFNRLPQSNSGLTVTSSNHAAATATINTTTGVLSLVGVGAGTSTITVTDTGTGHSNSLTLTVSSGGGGGGTPSQFQDDFPGVALDAAKWSDTSTPPAGATVASAHCTVAGSGGSVAGKIKTVNHYSLVTAAANGIQVTVTALTGGNSYVAFLDNTDHGYAFHFTGSLVESGTWNEPPSFTQDGSWSLGIATPILLRFAINGANIELSTSTNGGSTWTVRKSIAASGFNTAQVYVRIYAGTNDSITLSDVSVF